MHSVEQMQIIVNWYDNQNESLSFGLRTMQDAIKLYEYWEFHGDILPEFADEDSDNDEIDVAVHRVKALGYDPLA